MNARPGNEWSIWAYFMVVGAGVFAAGCAPTVTHSPALTIRIHADGVEAKAGAGIIVVDQPELFDARARRVQLGGALNEVVSFRIELRVAGAVDARIGEFTSDTGRVLAGNTTVYHAHHVRVDEWPGWHVRRYAPLQRQRLVADVLVPASAPRGGLPVRATVDQPVRLWVDVRIPRGTAPGMYSAPLAVLRDGVVVDEVGIWLNVWPFVLPDDADIDVVGDLDHLSLFAHHVTYGGQPCAPERVLHDHPAAAELEGVLTRTMRMLRDHRLTPQLPGLYPIVKVEGDERLSIDWSDYDRVVSGYVEGSAFAERVPLKYWRAPLDEHFPERVQDPSSPSPLYSRLLSDYAASVVEHFRERGWLARGYVQLPFSEYMGPEAQSATRQLGYTLRRAAPELLALSTLFPQDMTGHGWHGSQYEDLRDEVGIWAPRAQFFDRDAIVQDLGARVWFTVDRPPFSGTTSICGSAADARVLAWQAYNAGADAVRLGWVNRWPAPDSALDMGMLNIAYGTDDSYGASSEGRENAGKAITPQDCIAFDRQVLIYPGTAFGLNEPVASVRLKRLRRSMQDCAYLALLVGRGQEHVAAAIGEALAPDVAAQTYGVNFADGAKAGWVHDAALWDMARRIMADELLAGMDRGPRPDDALPQTIRWRRFMELTRGIRARVIGVRIHDAGAQLDEGVEIACTVALINETRTPVEGKLSFGVLPVGWTGVPASRFVPRIDPGGTRLMTLSAFTGSLAWNIDGALALPLVFERSDGQRDTLQARMSHVTAAHLSEPVVLDGQANEWPTGVGNDVGGFLLAVDADSLGGSLPAAVGRPRSATLCLVGQREDKLYFAIRCALSGDQRRDELLRRPRDVPDDMVPTGAEAVEILLDPSNSGSPMTEHIYRIVVGPGGAFWQWGLATEPPTSPARAWAAGVRHAVRVADDHWSAEIEVPLAAFGDVHRRQRVWGLNITRFDLEHQEYSNWAGVGGCVYNPRSLGNLTLP